MRISDWSSDVCSSDLLPSFETAAGAVSKVSHLVGQAHATPVLAGDDDGCRDVLHHHEAAAAHVAAIGLQQEGLGDLSGCEADAVVEDAPVAAVGGVPHRIHPLPPAAPLRVAAPVAIP